MKKYIFKFKGLFSLSILITFIESVMDVAFAFLLEYILDIGTSKNLSVFNKNLKFILLYLVSYFIVVYLKKLIQAIFIKKSIRSLKNNIFKSIIDKNISEFIKNDSASYISILTNDVNMIEQDYFVNLFDMTSKIIAFILASISIFWLNFWIAITVFIVGAAAILLPVIFSKLISTLRKNYSDSLSKLTINIKDVFAGFEVIKGFNIESSIKNEFDRYNTKTENNKFKFAKLSALIETLSSAVGISMFFITILVGTYLLIKGMFSVGKLLAAVQLMNSIVNPIVTLSSETNKLKSVKLIIKNINSICTEKAVTLKSESKLDFNKIEIKGLSFSYNEDKKILNNVNLTIEKGKKYAIVGKSGSGKSTLLKILLRYYNNFDGNILIDNTDVRTIKTEDIYNLISIMHQNVFMFDSTIKDNISLYKNYTDSDIEKAIKLSGLSDFINNKPNKLMEHVGENGCMLSGGEKQRIAVSRAIIRKTPILILDEATSALDNETAYNIEKSILNIDKLTCIVVTHKLSENILKYYDSIITLKDGNIEEQGNFNDLIEKKGYFYSLYNVYK